MKAQMKNKNSVKYEMEERCLFQLLTKEWNISIPIVSLFNVLRTDSKPRQKGTKGNIMRAQNHIEIFHRWRFFVVFADLLERHHSITNHS